MAAREFPRAGGPAPFPTRPSPGGVNGGGDPGGLRWRRSLRVGGDGDTWRGTRGSAGVSGVPIPPPPSPCPSVRPSPDPLCPIPAAGTPKRAWEGGEAPGTLPRNAGSFLHLGPGLDPHAPPAVPGRPPAPGGSGEILGGSGGKLWDRGVLGGARTCRRQRFPAIQEVSAADGPQNAAPQQLPPPPRTDPQHPGVPLVSSDPPRPRRAPAPDLAPGVNSGVRPPPTSLLQCRTRVRPPPPPKEGSGVRAPPPRILPGVLAPPRPPLKSVETPLIWGDRMGDTPPPPRYRWLRAGRDSGSGGAPGGPQIFWDPPSPSEGAALGKGLARGSVRGGIWGCHTKEGAGHRVLGLSRGWGHPVTKRPSCKTPPPPEPGARPFPFARPPSPSKPLPPVSARSYLRSLVSLSRSLSPSPSGGGSRQFRGGPSGAGPPVPSACSGSRAPGGRAPPPAPALPFCRFLPPAGGGSNRPLNPPQTSLRPLPAPPPRLRGSGVRAPPALRARRENHKKKTTRLLKPLRALFINFFINAKTDKTP